MTGEEPCANVGGGLIVANNETIRSFLHSASQNPQLSQSLCESASNLSHENSIPYKTLRDIWSASPSFSRPKLRLLFSASDFVFSSPKPREKSEELKERLRKLAELAEKNEYEELVKDIKPRKGNDEPFSSYKDQLGFGLHVALTMFTGFLVGYAAFRALFNHSAVMNAAGGIFGLVCAMLLETVLFIIRTSSQNIPSSSSISKQKKHQ
ncbi:uncharacterized protein LOC131232699 isoform X1 [Magnolia sinica]|uniref:uncharacterized protein LOC131232699 isoform X1 n=1 Tax=Magnolia sinica TaxID=86752 RepID=UPI00265A52E6|nr:uncharacterized protein LOC131232699 isoform X1 [Magnolia sinica]